VVIKSFEYVLNYVKAKPHFCHNKPITTWAQQYRSIMNEITDGTRQVTVERGAKDLNDYLKNYYNLTTAR
jgi:hypothetical protein